MHAHVKLGARQKSKRRYVKARGRHNKIRQKERGRPVKVEIGFKRRVDERGLINGKIPVVAYNLSDLKKIGKENIVIIGKIGKKKKIELAKELLNKKIEVDNLNVKKFLEKLERKEKVESKAETEESKKNTEKNPKEKI